MEGLGQGVSMQVKGASNPWNERKVLITGATGLLGYWLTKKCVEDRAQVTALVRDTDPQSELIRSGLIQKIKVVNGALEQLDVLERAIVENEIEYVFHLGAQTIVGTAFRNPLATFESNIRGTYLLLEACRRQKNHLKAVIVASSDKAYGSSDILPYREDMRLAGEHPYDVSKSCADLITSSYFLTYDLPVAIVRCGNLFGGADLNWSRLIPGTIRSLCRGEAPKIRSNGLLTRDYLYVEDAVNAYMALAQHVDREDVVGQSFNFGPNRPFSVLEIVEQIQALMGVPHLKVTIQNSVIHEIAHQSLSSEKAQRILNWSPHFSLIDGLKQTIEWYQNYLNATQQPFQTNLVFQS
jgi:CDP-glucose 4,6-dehydratase